MEFHVAVLPFSFLVGSWRGEGRGHYPTIDSFKYIETVTFVAMPDKPFLAYEQRTTSLEGVPMHTERGFLRFVGTGAVEFTIAQPMGQTELLEGTVSADRQRFELQSASIANSSTAKTVNQTRRRYALDSSLTSMHTEFDMAAVDQAMTNHLISDLVKLD